MNLAKIEIYQDLKQIIVNGLTISDNFSEMKIQKEEIPGVSKSVDVLYYHGLRALISQNDAYKLKQAGVTGETYNIFYVKS